MSGKKKIWIDLDNSPHVVFFRPIIAELEKRGYTVILTARDCFQVCGLADLLRLRYKKIGRHYGKNKILKGIGLLVRALQLMPTAFSEKPNLALSHGSRSQILAASILRIPSMVIFDYEHAKPLMRPTWAIAPEIIPDNFMRLDQKHIFRYPGIKEDVYVPTFKPDPIIIDELKINRDDLIVTMRPPATEAHYHDPQSEELFRAAIDFLCQKSNVHIVLLPRNDKQKALIQKTWPQWCKNSKIIIPEHVVDGLNLIWYSDLVISGGGTMNREAAALGVPVYSIFRGKTGAVDRYLAGCGRLVLLETIHDIQDKLLVVKRQRTEYPSETSNTTLNSIVKLIVFVAENKKIGTAKDQ